MFLAGILCACFAYAIYYGYDVLIVRKVKSKVVPFFFPLGTVFALSGTILSVLVSIKNYHFVWWHVIFMILAIGMFFLLLESLFFCLPKSTYKKPEEERMVYDEKMYALCRHPGVLFYLLFHLFLWFIVWDNRSMIIMLLLCILDILYMVLQDLYTFPRTFSNYKEYQKKVPFIVPTGISIRRCLKGYQKS